MKLKSLQVLSLLTVAVTAIVSQPEKASAIDLNFTTVDTTLDTISNPNTFGFNFGPGVSSNVIHYKNVASGVDAVVTATAFGANYSFSQHIYNYSVNTTGQPAGDAAFLYQIAPNQVGQGGLSYKFDFYQAGTNYTTAYVAPELRFLVYDVDGESVASGSAANQGEALRISKSSGLVGYQVGNNAQSLVPTQDATSYLFTGPGTNYAETSTNGATLLYFENTNSVTFQFEANTTAPALTTANPVFSAIDGDISMLGTNIPYSQRSFTGFGTYASTVSAPADPTTVPEPFTVIGSLIGGTAAFRMRKKLKATSKA